MEYAVSTIERRYEPLEKYRPKLVIQSRAIEQVQKLWQILRNEGADSHKQIASYKRIYFKRFFAQRRA
jgi:hypothetical protein